MIVLDIYEADDFGAAWGLIIYHQFIKLNFFKDDMLVFKQVNCNFVLNF